METAQPTYTECPNCLAVYRCSARHLDSAMGMVRCVHCKHVFNALSQLRDFDEGEQDSAENVSAQVSYERSAKDGNDAPGSSNQGGDANVAAAPAEQTAAQGPQPPFPRPRAHLPADGSPSPSGVSRLRRLKETLFGQEMKLAARNLRRHRRRTLFGGGCIAFGVIALMLAGGFAEWMMWAERESTIHSQLGHLQIVKDGYYESGVANPGAFIIEGNAIDPESILALPEVETVTPRLSFSGLISKGDTTVSFLGEGVAPETEAAVSKEVVVHAGDPLAASDTSGVLLGKGLAASLGANPGDAVVLVTTTEGGSISASDARVSGIFHTAVKAFDDVALRTHIELARRLNRTDGAHKLVVLLHKTEQTGRAQRKLESMLSANTAFEVVPWIDLADFYRAVVDLFQTQTAFVRAVIAVIIVLTISNTLAMSVRERTSEIGTLMALGYRSERIRQLFLSEGFLLGLAGGAGGTLIGYALARGISYVGIPMPPAPGMDHGFTAAIRVTWAIAIAGLVLSVIAAMVASVYPAIKASRMDIVDALRHSK